MPNLKLEQIHLKQFIKLFFKNEIHWEALPPPEPDFRILINGKIIGIEHCCLIRLPDENGVNVMAHSKIADKIMLAAEALYAIHQNMCLMVHVSFNCSYGLSSNNLTQLYNNDIEELSRFIAEFVTLQLPLLEATEPYASFAFETYEWSTGQRLLPEKIDHIRITNTRNFKHSCWSANQGGTIPGVYQSEELKTLLEKKNKKPKNYKSIYDELWLLIVEDSMDLTSYFHFEDQDIPIIKSTFSRVFILRRVEKTIHELKIIE